MAKLETPEQIIARVGWMVQLAFSHGDAPSFAHTIGLAAKGLPELIVFALHHDVAGYALNTLAQRISDGEQIACNVRVQDVLAADVQLIETSRELADRYMVQTGERYPHYRALQVVWPDPKTGAFPWEDGYAERCVRLQPLLRPTLQ